MRILFAGALLCSLSLAGCDALDTKEDLNLTDEMMATRRYQMFDWATAFTNTSPTGSRRSTATSSQPFPTRRNT